MSESTRRSGPRRAAWTALALAACCSVSVARAVGMQVPEPDHAGERVRLQAKLDSLSRLVGDARARSMTAAQAYLQSERSRVMPGTDTLRVGLLKIVVLHDRGERARPYFAKAWAHFGPLLAGEVPDELEERIFVFQDGLVIEPLDLAAPATWVSVRPWTPSSVVEARVRRAVGSTLHASLRLPQSTWVEEDVLTAQPDFEATYRKLTTGPSASLGRCKAGDKDACWLAMGVTSNTEPVEHLRAWYTDDQRRAFALDVGLRIRSWRDCAANDLPACDELLLASYGRLTPLDAGARASLVSVAIEMGGEGAFARYGAPVTLPADFREILSRTAGAPPDAVMSEWLERVIAAKPDRPRADREARLGTMLWILLFMAFAARSTRWRLA